MRLHRHGQRRHGPWWWCVRQIRTVSCSNAWTFDLPTATTCCTNQIVTSAGTLTNILVTSLGIVTNGVCPQYITQTWLIADGCGNSNICSQTVTVPCCPNNCLTVNCPSNIMVTACGPCAQVFYAATATNPCCPFNAASPPITLSYSPPSGTCFPVGVNTVQVTATDNCGNVVTCNFTVTVNAGTGLVVVCPTNKTVSCSNAWTFDPPTATTCCTNQIVTSAGTLTNILVTSLGIVTNGACPQYITQTWLIADGCGNSNMCSQTVTVPCCPPNCIILTCPPNLVVMTCSNCAPAAYAATAIDPCCKSTSGTSPVTLSYNPPPGTCLPLGVNTVQVTATDTCGNSSTCSFTVTVIPSGFQVVCPTNKTVSCSNTWTFDPPTATTCCPKQFTTSAGTLTNILITSLGIVTNGTCPQYITQTWLITDGCGNRGTCSQTVTVPCCPPNCITLICPSNIVVTTCGNCASAAYAATVIDPCCTSTNGTPAVTVSYSPPSGTCFPLGVSTVQVTAADTCGNISTCSFTVTVNPGGMQVICPTNKTVSCASAWTFDPPLVTSCCTNQFVTSAGTVDQYSGQSARRGHQRRLSPELHRELVDYRRLRQQQFLQSNRHRGQHPSDRDLPEQQNGAMRHDLVV